MLTITVRAGDAGAIEAYYAQLNEEVRQGRGPEDYYSAEAPGVWMGGAAEQLGLANQRVHKGDFARAATGYLPDGSGQVQNAGKEGRRSGYDFCFNAPKSVSVAWAFTHPAEKAEIDHAIRRATARALEYAERHGIVVRYGKAGKYKQRGKVLASVYTHHTNRNQDPHLHCHAFVHNVVIGEDGKPRTLEMRDAKIWEKAIGAAFRVELAREMQELGYTVRRQGEGFELAEVDPRLIDEFSSRSKDIKQHLEEQGRAYSYESAHRAGLDTRRKKALVEVAELEALWRERKAEALQRPAIELEPEPEPEGIDIQLTAQQSVFTEAQAAALWMQSVQGLPGGIEFGEEVAREYLAERVVKLGGGKFTTPEQYEREQALLAASDELWWRRSHALPLPDIQAAVERASTLSEEQTAAVREILNGGDLSLLQGAAGAGKTFSLKTVVEAYREAGYEVHGLAPSAEAGKVLAEETGVSSATVARELINLDERGKVWKPGSVYICDEAGMLNTSDGARLIEAARESGAKLILVGDTKQLQAIQAGAPFRALQERHGHAALETSRRQIDPRDREIVNSLRAGKAEEVVQGLIDRGRIHSAKNDREAKAALARDLVDDLSFGRRSYGLAQRRRAVADINENVREILKARGELRGGRVASVKYRDSSTGKDKTVRREFAPGDRIVLMRNVNVARRKREMGGDIVNGAKGIVETVQEGRVPSSARLRIHLDDGTFREFDTAEYPHLDHAYALTVHKSQGETWDRCRVFAGADDFGAREAGYVSLSRAKEATHFYGDREAVQDLARGWEKEAQKLNALDFEPAPEEGNRSPGYSSRQHGDLNKDEPNSGSKRRVSSPEGRDNAVGYSSGQHVHLNKDEANTGPVLADALGFNRRRTRPPAAPNSDEALRRQRQAEGAQILRERERAAARAKLGIPDWRDEPDPERRRELKELERKALGAKRLRELREQQREERIERGLEPEPPHHQGPSMSPGM